jgi:Flp pilus assembly pilin Flp
VVLPGVHCASHGELILGLLTKLIGYFTGGVAKSVTGPLKDGTGMAKDITGIRKDRVDTQIAELDLAEKRSLITRATLDEVKEYDRTYQKIRVRLHANRSEGDFIEYALLAALVAFFLILLVDLLFLGHRLTDKLNHLFELIGNWLHRFV